MSFRKWFNKHFTRLGCEQRAGVKVVEGCPAVPAIPWKPCTAEDQEFLERCAASPPRAIVDAATSSYFDKSVAYVAAGANRKLLTRKQRVDLAKVVLDAEGLQESDLELMKALMAYTPLQTKRRLFRRWCRENDLPMPAPVKVRVPRRRAKKTLAEQFFED